MDFERRMWVEKNPVRLARLKKDISRRQLARTTGLNRKGLYYVEHGITVNPRLDTFFTIADALDEDAVKMKEDFREWLLENPDREEEEEDGQNEGS